VVIGPFHIAKAKSKAIKTRDGTGVEARHFVYKLWASAAASWASGIFAGQR
jgi:hypothetical protein